MTSKEWSLRKKIIVGILVAAIIFAIVIGVVYVAVYSNMGKVKVISVYDTITYDYDSDSMSIEGTISTGVTQDVTSEDGKVSEILVKQGDYVEKGTALVRLDSTQASLELEQAKIDLQGKQVDLNDAKAKLDMLNNAQSYVETIQVPIDEEEESAEESAEESTDTSDEEDSDSASDEDASETTEESEDEEKDTSADSSSSSIGT